MKRNSYLEILRCRSCGHERKLDESFIVDLSVKLDRLFLTIDYIEKNLCRFKCSKCGGKDIVIIRLPAHDRMRRELLRSSNTKADSKKWQVGKAASKLIKVCVTCGKPIPSDEFKKTPKAQRCFYCQKSYENKIRSSNKEAIFCKICGSEMVWRLRNASPSKYFLGCSNYPKCKYVIAGSW